MVNQENHQVVDMIPSRNIAEVVEWLKLFENVETVTRDGSLTYHSAIDSALPTAAQITDRFHLVKGLSEAVMLEIDHSFKSTLVEEIIVESSERLSLKERFDAVKSEVEEGAELSESCKKHEIKPTIYKKLLKMDENERATYFCPKPTAHELEQKKRLEKRTEKVNQIRKLLKQGLSLSEISRQTKTDRRTIKKYRNDDYVKSVLNMDKRRSRGSGLDKFKDKIVELYMARLSVAKIYSEITAMGYKGNYHTVLYHVQKLKRQNKLTLKTYVTPSQIKGLLFWKREEENLNKKYLLKIYKENPKVKKLVELFLEFKSILLRIRKEEYLMKWMEKAKALNLSSINSFVAGLERDIQAVKHAITHDYSNGVVEARVNSTKLTKRIMFGRSSFETIRSKTLRLQQLRQ